MLKKLIRHEWSETFKIPCLGLLTFLILSGICALYFFLSPALTADVELNVGNLFLFISYAFISAALSLLITVYLGIRYYKNLYTDEGYLMHTLPVPAWMHLTAKTINGVFWCYVLSLVTTVTVLPVTVIALPKIGYLAPEEVAEIRTVCLMLLGNSLPELLFYFIPYLVSSVLFSVLLLYAAISLGQLFGKHRVFSSIICYLGLNALTSAVVSAFMVPGLTGMIITRIPDATEDAMTLVFPTLMDTIFLASLPAHLLLAAACFVLCHYLLKKNLNLD